MLVGCHVIIAQFERFIASRADNVGNIIKKLTTARLTSTLSPNGRFLVGARIVECFAPSTTPSILILNHANTATLHTVGIIVSRAPY